MRDNAIRHDGTEADERCADTLELSSLQLFQRIRDAAIIADVETGRILLWNPAAEELFGYESGEVIGLSVDDLVPERLRAQHRAGFARYRQTGQGPFIDADNPIEVPALRKTAEEVVVELTLSSLDETPTGRRLVLAIMRDITARKRAEAAEHVLAEVGKALTSSLHVATMFHNLARLCVPALADWCAVDIIEPDRSIRRLAVASIDPAKTDRACERENSPPKVLCTGEPRLYEEVPDALSADLAGDSAQLRILRQRRPRSAMLVPLIARGQSLGTIAFLSMESGRRYRPEDLALAEELARRAALAADTARLYSEAQRAVRVRDEFLASASHELRTPLSHIKGFVSTLRQTDVEWDEEARRDFLAEIEHETDRLANLIGDLLDLSRLESGGLAPAARAPARIADLVADGLDRVHGLLSDRSVSVELPTSLPPAYVDASQITRVVANLIENAAKYSPAGSWIRIVGAQVGREVEFRVEDEGPGILPQDFEWLFDKYFRGRSDESRVPGTGLGLPIARGIIEAQGGRIWAENRHEGGARFVVRLPVASHLDGDVPRCDH